MREEYRTVLQEAEGEITEKRSRFIATVKPVKTEEEALEFLEAIKKKYWDARHNVYAYVIEENNIQRYSDDGEPAGTAGTPVLDLIKKEGLSNIIVVVTRYFGGILLGTGGLVHAYSKSARLGILAAEPTKMVLCKEVTVEIDYSLLGKVQNEIFSQNLKIFETEYKDSVLVKVFIPEKMVDAFTEKIIDTTSGRGKVSLGETMYIQT